MFSNILSKLRCGFFNNFYFSELNLFGYKNNKTYIMGIFFFIRDTCGLYV